jgi:hypothetical protein
MGERVHARTPVHTHVPVHVHSHAHEFVHRRLRVTVPPTGSSSCRALHSRVRRATKAKAELSVVPVSRHIWPTTPNRAHTLACHREARRRGQATGMPAHSHTHGRAWTPPLAGPMLTVAHASSPRAREIESRPNKCCGVCVALVVPHRPSCPRQCWTPPPRRCVFPVFRHVNLDLVLRPDARTRTRSNHHWASPFSTVIFCSQDGIPAA